MIFDHFGNLYLDLLSGILEFFRGMFCLQKMFDQLPLGNQKKVISNSRWILKIPLPTLRSKHALLLVIFVQRAITRPTFGLEQKHML